MFDSIKQLAQLGPMLSKAKQMQDRMQEVQRRVPSLRSTGQAGPVTVIVSGEFQVVDYRIAATASTSDLQTIADMGRMAVNQAMRAMALQIQAESAKAMEGVDLGAMQDAMKSLGQS
ncbi:MAG: YbaB/EbfC family nucleoid-associated protein [Phycisphaerae bacterium]|jgi:DNA-binding protein YbaB